MPIRDKDIKKFHSDSRIKIDVIHKNKIINYQQKENNYLKSKKILEKIKTNIFDEQYIYHSNIIKEYEDNNLDNEDNYYLDNGLLLNNYYNDIYDITNTEKDKDTILNWFDKSNINSECDEEKNDKDIIDKNNGENKYDIIIKYLSKIDDKYLDINMTDDMANINVCNICKNSMIFKINESEMYCEKCGYTEDILSISEKCSFKDVPKEISYFAYKRINHFNEWIAQIQSKESTAIPQEVYIKVMEEIKKDPFFKIDKITNKQVRDILKFLNYNKYYEHVSHILNVITGNKKLIVFGEYEDVLRTMFKEIQLPFMNNCPNERKNFLSYSYVLHKFCQLLELDNLLEYFPLLKSREKLKQQDVIWKKICNDLKWEYIPSI